MAKYRTKLQIIAEILEIARVGSKKTHIMYKANLSYKLLCQYLEDVVECGFIEVDDNDHYVVAPKGEQFLERYTAYLKLREHVDEELGSVGEKRSNLEQMFMSPKS